MPARILKTDRDREAWVRFLSAQELPLTVTSVRGAKRSLPQNSLFHQWVAQIATETGQSQTEAKAEIKLTFGLPIMERDRPDWIAEWSPLYGPLPYHMRRKLFQVIPLTSLLTARQMAEMMDAIEREYRAQGVALVDPEAAKWEAFTRA